VGTREPIGIFAAAPLDIVDIPLSSSDDRDGVVGDHLMDEAELDTRSYAEIEIQAPLRLIDLTDDGPVRMGIPSDAIRSSKRELARRWSEAIDGHSAQVDGILYRRA
jgi:hypothetical protein